MRIKKLAQDKRGISLVEIMVGMLIFSIISMTIIVIMFPTLNSINKTKDLSEMGIFADNISAEIINDIKMANSIEIINDIKMANSIEIINDTKMANIIELSKESEPGDTLTLVNQEHTIVYKVIDGRIKRNYDAQKNEDGAMIFNDLVSSKYYENKSVNVSYDTITKDVGTKTITLGCKIKIEVLNKEGETAITREYSVLSLVI